MYIETSWPRQPNDKAWLQSGMVKATSGTSGRCLKFWYHMWGAHVNRLNVYRQIGNTKTRFTTLANAF